MTRKLLWLALWLAPILVACTSGATPATKPTPTPGPAPALAAATIQDIRHQNLTVKPGTTVTWTNQDGVPHTVREEGQKFKSGFLNKGDTFSFTFREAGTFKYFCEVHPDDMRAAVVVAP